MRATAEVFAEEFTCWLCGRLVVHALPAHHAQGHTVDHLIQLQHGGDPRARTNLRLAHRSCNSARSNRLRGLDPSACACRYGLACSPMPRGATRDLSISINDL